MGQKRIILLISLLSILIAVTIWITEKDTLRYMTPKSYSEIASQTWNHLKMVGLAELLAIGLGVPLGILITRPGIERFSGPIAGAVSIGQSLPSLAVVAIMAPLLGYGVKSAVIALFIYALLPVFRNSYAGIRDINPSIIEAARGMGMSRGQIAWKIELPLARPVIIAGIRTSTVVCVGTATLAVLIGGGGLGAIILAGVFTNIPLLTLQGAAPAAVLAIVLDVMLERCESWMTPRGLKVSER